MKHVTLRTTVFSVIVLVCALAAQPTVVGAQGTGWTIQSTPTDQDPSSLSSVSCFNAKSCVAAGRSTNLQGNTVPAAEHWNGKKWSRSSLPNPKQSTDAELLGMSCLSSPFCFAVGFATYPSSATPQLPIAEVRGSFAVWSVHLGVSPAGAALGRFNGASCISTTHCMVVGEYSSPGTNTLNTPLAETWFGTGWAPKRPLPGWGHGGFAQQRRLQHDQRLHGCRLLRQQHKSSPAAGREVEWQQMVASTRSRRRAVARARLHWHYIMHRSRLCYFDDRLRRRPVVGRAVERNELDGRAGTGRHVPERVSCTSATTCVAVGANGTGTYATVWNGTAWADQTTPNPTGATSSVLNGVFCVSVTSCEAVGSYLDSASQQHTLAEVYAG